jgi:hypothetical protein
VTDGSLAGGEEPGNRLRPLAQVARRDVIGIRNTSYTDCTEISTSVWSMVAVGRVERARESIRNDDLRTLFFVLLFISRRRDKAKKTQKGRLLRFFDVTTGDVGTVVTGQPSVANIFTNFLNLGTNWEAEKP